MTTNIFAIAIQLGWTTTPRYKDGELYIDFHRKTLSGVPFSFTAKMGEGKIGNLVKEIESFVDAIDPEICAEEWMIKSGVIAPSRLQQAISDMDAFFHCKNERWEDWQSRQRDRVIRGCH